MSILEEIYIKADLTPVEAAERIVDALGMEIVLDEHGVFVRAPEGIGDIPGVVGGKVGPNIYSNADDPDDCAPYDSHPLVWELRRPYSDEETQIRAARAIFDRMTRALPWRLVLVHDLDLLIAAWDPHQGLREFPPETGVDGVDEATIWKSTAPP